MNWNMECNLICSVVVSGKNLQQKEIDKGAIVMDSENEFDISAEDFKVLRKIIKQLKFDDYKQFEKTVSDFIEVEIRQKAILGELELIVYSSHRCPDSISCINLMDKLGVKYEIRDISKNMDYLREFLKIRDKYHEFQEIDKDRSSGLPCIYVSEKKIILDWKNFLKRGCTDN